MRTLSFYLYCAYFLGSSLLSLEKAKRHKKKGQLKKLEEIRRKMVYRCTSRLVKIAGASVEVSGKENIPKEEAVLYVGNHQGNYDIPLISTYIDSSISYIAKKELSSIPLLSSWMKVADCVFVDRQNPRESVKSLEEGINLLKGGRSLFIFPEGTRSRGDDLGDFKSAGLRLAKKSGVKVVPVSIDGSYKLMEENGGKVTPANVKINIGEPIAVSNETNLKDLAEEIKNTISQLKLEHK